jgi:hypothetical protein
VLELLDLRQGPLAGLLGQPGLGDALLELGHLIALLAVAELLLNGLHLLVEVVLALGLLHLALDPRADALFDLQNRDLSLHEGIDPLQALVDRQDLEQLLLLIDLDGDMGCHRIGELGGIVDLGDGRQGLLRHLLVELHIAFELRNDGAGERLGLAGIAKMSEAATSAVASMNSRRSETP